MNMLFELKPAPASAKRLPRVLLQCFLAGVFIFGACFVSVYTGGNILIAACLAPSAAIAFTLPKSDISRARHIIGGCAASSACGLFMNLGALGMERYGLLAFDPDILFCSLAVFAALLCMTLLNFRHPPAAAFAAILTISESPLLPLAQLAAAVLLLCLVKRALIRVLIDL